MFIWHAPDTSGGLYIADGTMPADGTIAALGVFNPKFITFVGRNIAHPSNQFSFVTAAPPALQLWHLRNAGISACAGDPDSVRIRRGIPQSSVRGTAACVCRVGSRVCATHPELRDGIASGWMDQQPGHRDFRLRRSILPARRKLDMADQRPNFAKLGGVNFVLQNNGNGTQSYLGGCSGILLGARLRWPTKTVLPGTTICTHSMLSPST